jgi:hypothetical protein
MLQPEAQLQAMLLWSMIGQLISLEKSATFPVVEPQPLQQLWRMLVHLTVPRLIQLPPCDPSDLVYSAARVMAQVSSLGKSSKP